MNESTNISLSIQNFREFYDLYYEAICRFLLFYTHDRQLIEDITQEIFVSLWEKRESLEITHIKAYLFQSAKNKILNRMRDERNRSVLLEKWFNDQLHSRYLDRDKFETEKLLTIASQAIDTLPEKCKEIFVLNKTQQLTYKQIAALKNISVKTVENQMGIALKKTREYILKHYPATISILATFFF